MYKLTATIEAIEKLKNIIYTLPDSDNCQLWYKHLYGGKYKKGYPFLGIRIGGRNGEYFDFKVPRLIAHIVYNLNLEDKTLLACHKCNNKRCINKKHIYVGTHENNMTDLSNSDVLKSERKKQKFCKRGHRLTEDNLYYSNDHRTCKQCTLERSKVNYDKRMGVVS